MKQYEYRMTHRRKPHRWTIVFCTAASAEHARAALQLEYTHWTVAPRPDAEHDAHRVYGELDATACDLVWTVAQLAARGLEV